MARRHIDASPYADRITVMSGRRSNRSPRSTGAFDLVFIDADKANYADYFEAVLPRLADHGLIAIDNTLWSGEVLDPQDDTSVARSPS